MSSQEFVDLVGHIAWPSCIFLVLILLKPAVQVILDSIAKRIKDEKTSFAIGPQGIEIKAINEVNPDLIELKSTPAQSTSSPQEASTSEEPTATRFAVRSQTSFELEKKRAGLYQSNRNLFLVHILEPATDSRKNYDIFIYLKRHKSTSMDDVSKAEFFFGKAWGNRVFEGSQVNGTIGIRTSAYGEFLCLCRVHFTDGSNVLLSRYIDFESGKYVSAVINQATESLRHLR